ncbi:hypothetical protein FRB94_000070 [Tulasnella sp. JGI-2019a]|nr:hypothetical protein FRB94_000070 [Tulasnella sp. JGI-2019a]
MDACASGEIPEATISLVISNRKAAYGLTRARNASPPIPTDYLALAPFLKGAATQAVSPSETISTVQALKPTPARTRVDYDLEIARMILQFGRPDLVVLAGWMHVLSPEFLDVLEGRTSVAGDVTATPHPEPSTTSTSPIPIINLHPALPGAFDGANAIQRAYDAFQAGEISNTGIMVHRVISEVDQGEPVIVKDIEIKKDESIEALEERIHAAEHVAIVQAAKKVLQGARSSP